MLRGTWDGKGRCDECSSDLRLQGEYLDRMPPVRVYRCKEGHENLRYMRNIKAVAEKSSGIGSLLE